jgi:hypothetical protein
MRLKVSSVVVLLCCAMIPACMAGTLVNVHVNGYASDGAAIPMGSAIAVLENPKAENPLFEHEVARKVATLLVAKGFRIVPADGARQVLIFTYGIGPTVTTSWSSGDRTDIKDVNGNKVGSLEGPSKLVSETASDRRLIVSVIGMSAGIDKARLLWRGETKSVGSTDDLRTMIDYLLVPTIDRIGQNANKSLQMWGADSRVRALQKP